MNSEREEHLIPSLTNAGLAHNDNRTKNARHLASFFQRATDLFNQQRWCWGRDILRPEGNWLMEVGFERIPPPAERRDCSSSVYRLLLSDGRCVVLRGFGAFFGDPDFGGLFLSRNKLTPSYSSRSILDCMPWSDIDLPKMEQLSQKNHDRSLGLISEFFRWIYEYEANVLGRLGLEYRQATLSSWPRGKRTIVRAEDFADTWRSLSSQLATALIPVFAG